MKLIKQTQIEGNSIKYVIIVHQNCQDLKIVTDHMSLRRYRDYMECITPDLD